MSDARNHLETLGEEYRNARRERDRWWQMTSVLQDQINAELKPLAQKWGAMTAFIGRAGLYCRRNVWMEMANNPDPKSKTPDPRPESEGQAYCSLDVHLKCGLEIKLRLRARPEDMAEAAKQLKAVVGVLQTSSKFKVQSSKSDGGSTESRPTSTTTSK